MYRYHVVELDEQLVVDNTAFVLTPLKSKLYLFWNNFKTIL